MPPWVTPLELSNRHGGIDVLEGALTIQMRDREVVVGPGQLFVVPRGVEHCPKAEGEVKALLFEAEGVVNTGNAGGDLTANVEAI